MGNSIISDIHSALVVVTYFYSIGNSMWTVINTIRCAPLICLIMYYLFGAWWFQWGDIVIKLPLHRCVRWQILVFFAMVSISSLLIYLALTICLVNALVMRCLNWTVPQSSGFWTFYCSFCHIFYLLLVVPIEIILYFIDWNNLVGPMPNFLAIGFLVRIPAQSYSQTFFSARVISVPVLFVSSSTIIEFSS